MLDPNLADDYAWPRGVYQGFKPIAWSFLAIVLTVAALYVAFARGWIP